MKYGLTEATVDKIKGVFARFPAIKKAVLYGSRAKGNFKTGSDIDLTLYGESLTSDLHGKIAEALDDLLLPYTVDLSIFDDLDHAKLREHIERVGVAFYERVNQGGTMKVGWEVRKLGEVCKYDKTPNRKSNLPYVGLENIESNSGKFIGSLEPQKVKSLTFHFSDEHVLYGRLRPYLNKVLLPDFEGHCSTEIFPIMPSKHLNSRFLFHWLLSGNTVKKINSTCTGTRMPRANMNVVLKFELPLPPLPEQKRIVAILDEVFKDIATAKANAEKNLQNARELFENTHQSVFTHKGEGGWIERQLGDLATFRNGINFTKSSSGDSVKILGVKDFQDNFLAPLDNLDTITTDGTLPDSDILKENDILFVRSNGNMQLIGRSLLVGAITERIAHSGFTIRARLNNSGLIAKYLCHFLKSNNARNKMIDSGIGTNIKSLNQATLSALTIPFPSRAEQARIVAKLDALSAEAKKLEAIYQQKLTALEELKKSVLNKAFSGELN